MLQHLKKLISLHYDETTEAELLKTIELLTLVQTMRSWQAKYFKDRLQGDLKKAKQYESLVDRKLEELIKFKSQSVQEVLPLSSPPTPVSADTKPTAPLNE